MISFLNALLEETEKEKIRHIEYVDTKLSDIEAVDDKIGILDVRVITEKGIHINVEIQLINRYNMIKRTLFYWSRLYSSQIQFVELPKFLEEQPELNSSLNKWLTFLTKPEKGVMEVVEMGEPAIRKAITVLDMLSRDPETVRLAELRMKKILDEKSMLEGAKEEGRDERNKEIAQNALSKGADISFVVEITGLSEEEVIKIKNEMVN